ncbi:hypothetical protein [Polaribacter sp. R77954]|uniref:hypothetical protein n=1 Tax=Polaribacter sp. R77954 TaxID=3093870 RepID=UPI0037C8C7FF
MKRYLLFKYLPYSILLIAILTIQPYTTLPLIGSTFVSWFLQFILLYSFYAVIPHLKTHKKPSFAEYAVVFYILYNIISFIRGLFVAETYWDYKALFANGLALLLPVVAFAGMNMAFVVVLLKYYLKYTLPLFIFFFPFISSGAVGFYLVPISFFAIFLPIIRRPWNFIVLTISLFVVFFAFGARSNVIKFFIPVLFSMFYYFRYFIGNKVLRIIRNVLFILPFVLFLLAISGSFNIFKINEYIRTDAKTESTNVFTGEKSTEDLTTDTRTDIYIEVLKTAKKYNTWVFGRSPARGNETELFSDLADITGRQERSSNEVAILNVFMWTGLIGVFFYFIIFYFASYLALNRSNNYFSKLLGIYLAFRWCYAWVEDINFFTLTTFMLWITIGVCMSSQIRKMNNQEIILWINAIFSNKLNLKFRMYWKKKLIK